MDAAAEMTLAEITEVLAEIKPGRKRVGRPPKHTGTTPAKMVVALTALDREMFNRQADADGVTQADALRGLVHAYSDGYITHHGTLRNVE